MSWTVNRARIVPSVLFAKIWCLHLLTVNTRPLSAKTKRNHSKIRLCADTYTLSDILRTNTIEYEDIQSTPVKLARFGLSNRTSRIFRVTGYPQRMRLQRRLYRIGLVRFLAFRKSRVPRRQKRAYFCCYKFRKLLKYKIECRNKSQAWNRHFLEFWVVFTVSSFVGNPVV